MEKRRIVVTGLGMVTPLALDTPATWSAMLAGTSGIGPLIVDFDLEKFPTRIGGQVRGFDPLAYMSGKDARRMDTFVQYGVAAAQEAIRDAALVVTPENAERIGLAIGSGIGGIEGIEKNHLAFLENDHSPRKISPFFVPSSIINMVAGNLSIMHGIKGPNLAVVTACTSGAHNIGLSARLIQAGDADIMIAGGAEMSTTPISLGGFCAARALSTRNDEPTRASRPFDRDRDGFVMGDGAGILVLESLESAQARGVPIYAELVGFGMSADAHHITQPSEGGEGAARCMVNALRDAGLAPAQIDYINAHGTSTPAGDIAETQAIKRAFGEHARRLAVSSTKSMTGHMLGAAGAVEAAFSILALRDQILPPTINLDQPDAECDLDYVPHQARPARLEHVLSNSFGFGGTNGSLIFRRVG
ncbi:MAG TPA: beta-ketoacyl-ACP synthase II [Candidatus Macondimonas sp.]|nr:beta-ketoacyl-ACP synthase II [Candidatus Macondimonas sp.]